MLLTSCTSLTKLLKVKTDVADVQRQTYVRSHAVKSPSVHIVVVTPKRTAIWNKEVKEGKRRPYVYFGYDDNNYLTFEQWLQNLLNYVKSQNAVIDAYENDSKEFNKRIKADD